METYNVFSGDEARNVFGKARPDAYSETYENRDALAENNTQFYLEFYDEVKSLLKNKEIYVLDGPVALFEDKEVLTRKLMVVEEYAQPTVKDAAKLFCDMDDVKNSSKVFLYVVQRLRSAFFDLSSDEEIPLVDLKTFQPYKRKGRIKHGVTVRFAVL